jgi:hypothetical protein
MKAIRQIEAAEHMVAGGIPLHLYPPVRLNTSACRSSRPLSARWAWNTDGSFGERVLWSMPAHRATFATVTRWLFRTFSFPSSCSPSITPISREATKQPGYASSSISNNTSIHLLNIRDWNEPQFTAERLECVSVTTSWMKFASGQGTSVIGTCAFVTSSSALTFFYCLSYGTRVAGRNIYLEPRVHTYIQEVTI